MDGTPEVSVVIVNWQGRETLTECLESVLAQRGASFEVILVDNASTDGGLELARQRFGERIRIIRNPQNLGFGAGNNRGVEHARGKWIALLNNDAAAHPWWLASMLRAADRNPGAAMIACRVMNYEDRALFDNTGHLIFPDGLNRGRGRMELDVGQYESERDTLFPSGCAALIRTDIYREAGGFYEPLFAYGDDTDLGLSIRRLGWGCVYEPSAIVFHHYSRSSSAHSEFKGYFVERNRFWLMLRQLPWKFSASAPLWTSARYALQAVAAISGHGASGGLVQHSGWKALARAGIWANAAAMGRLLRELRERERLRRGQRLPSSMYAQLLREHRIHLVDLVFRP